MDPVDGEKATPERLRGRAGLAGLACLLLASCSLGGRAVPAKITPGDYPGKGPTAPLLSTDRKASPEEFQLAIGRYLTQLSADPQAATAAASKVNILKSVVVSDAAFALATRSTTAGVELATSSFTKTGSIWRVDALTLEDLTRVASPPTAGSDGFAPNFVHGPPSLADNTAVLGFVDPTASRVDAVTSLGQYIDSDVPTRGVTIVIARTWAQIRVYRGGRVLRAFPVVDPVLQPAQDLDDQARTVADQFVSALLSRGWKAAAPSFEAVVHPELILPPFEQFLTGRSLHVQGEPRVENGRFVYHLFGANEQGSLLLRMFKEGEKWKVLFCEYANGLR
jgi:hypothetical protein